MPVYLVAHLLRSPRRLDVRPERIVTNNIPVAVLELIAGGLDVDETQVAGLPESPLDIRLTSGMVMEAYAATIPWALSQAESREADGEPMVKALADEGVDHIILMTTRISAEEGPCAVGMANRRHKRLLLRYALDQGARVTVMAEATKIVERRDDSAGQEFWRQLIEAGRIRLICAFDQPLSAPAEGAIRRQIDRMRSLGLEVVVVEA